MSSLTDTRDSRRRKLGIDCVGRVIWRHWEPGNEYIKKIRIRNLDTRQQTIRYEQPLHKEVFLLDFPEPVTLNSGMSHDLEVRFCPTSLVELQGMIKVTVVGRGSFMVYLECHTPYAKLQVPTQHDFPFVAVGRTATHTVTMKNSGTIAVAFEWRVPEPFAIVPSRGFLAEDESVELRLSFAPVEACALVARAVCRMAESDDVLASVKLSGVAKYPFLRVVEPPPLPGTNALRLDFGRLLVATERAKEFSVENPSVVDAVFALEAAADAITCPFTVTPAAGIIKRGATQKFRVTFAPTVAGAVCVNAYRLTTAAGNSVAVQLRGVAVAPVVRVSTTAIDFGDVRLGEGDDGAATSTKVGLAMGTNRQSAHQRFFLIKNASEVAQEFCFMPIFTGAVFVVEPVTGEIPAKGRVRVRVEFHPTHPINYLRRLLILVKNSGNLLYVDVFGTAYDGFVRPLPFKAKDVGAFFLRHKYGLAGAQPEELATITDSLRSGCSYKDISRKFLLLSSDSATQARDDTNMQGDEAQNALQSTSKTRKHKGRLDLSYLLVPFSENAPFCVSTDTLTFSNDVQESRQITVFNRTNTVATAYWCVPRGSLLVVLPMQEDIPPQSSCSFTVVMPMDISSALTDQFIECYVNFKQMRSFRLVDEGAFTPPHFFTVRCQRELLMNPSDLGTIASLVHTNKSIIFPACRAGETVNTVLDLENRGNVAILFSITIKIDSFEPKGKVEKNMTDRSMVFTDPVRGLLPPHQRFPVILSFEPTIVTRFRGRVIIKLNNSSMDEVVVPLCGESFSPELVVEDSSMIVLRPTCLTGHARRKLKIFNPTCIPVSFTAYPSEELVHVLELDPPFGVLGAGEQMELTLIFSPSEAIMYEGRINFLISDSVTVNMRSLSGGANSSRREEGVEDEKENIISCPCMGEGRYAEVEVEPVSMEHEGPAMKEKTFELTIYNSGLCDVCYEVRWLSKKDVTHPHHQNPNESKVPPVKLSHNKSGTLVARSHTVVLVTFRPQTGLSEFILYILVAGSGALLSTIPHPTNLGEVRQLPHCEVRLRGTRPAIQITDVRSLEQHRSQLWCQMSINSVNEVLAAPVQPTDLETDAFSFFQYICGIEPIFMDLGVGSVLDARNEILVCFENTGSCPVSFRFWYPTDHEGGNETWFLDDEELEDVQEILCDRLVEISPREGVIPVRSQKTITIAYHHKVQGTHSLPVLLRLDEGKKVLLVLEGRTVSPDSKALAFHHPSVYNLHPVALGDLEPPLQTTVIENVTSQPVAYVVQEDLTQQVSRSNCGFPVFQCLNPTGVIPVRGSVQLHWYFRPLEARVYHIDASLRTVNGEEYDVQFVGVGYHPKRIEVESACTMINNAFLSIPVSPALRLPVKKCPVSLSMDVMHVGAAPSFSLHRRICYVENRHPHHTYSFLWKTHLEPGSSRMVATPPDGVVGPGQRVRCGLSLYCGSLSQVLETSVFCIIRNETIANASGRRERRNLGPTGTRAEEETGDDDDNDGAFDDPILDAKTPPGKVFERPTCTKPKLGGTNRKRLPVTSLPPEYQSARVIAATTVAAAAAAASRKNNRNLNINISSPLPQIAGSPSVGSYLIHPTNEDSPVMDHALEVLVQARIMPIEEYERLFGMRALQQMHFPTLWQNYVDPKKLPLARDQRVETAGAYSRDEMRVAMKVLDGLLRAVIAHPRVRAAFTESVKGDIPYYREIVHACFRASSFHTAAAASSSSCNGGGPLSTAVVSATAIESTSAGDTTKHSVPSARTNADAQKRFPSPSSLELKPGEAMLRDGALMNSLEELLADVTLQAVGTVIDKLHGPRREGSRMTKS